MKWTKDELKNRNAVHMLFSIKTGVLRVGINSLIAKDETNYSY